MKEIRLRETIVIVAFGHFSISHLYVWIKLEMYNNFNVVQWKIFLWFVALPSLFKRTWYKWNHPQVHSIEYLPLFCRFFVSLTTDTFTNSPSQKDQCAVLQTTALQEFWWRKQLYLCFTFSSWLNLLPCIPMIFLKQ